MAKKEPDPQPLPPFRPSGRAVPQVNFDQLGAGSQIIDVRSPREFDEDHIPGSILVPLLDDEERQTTGALYREEGPESATRWAQGLLNHRLDLFFDQLRDAVENSPETVITCARGGDRSRHVVEFLNERGFVAKQLVGGYRSYREGIRRQLEGFTIPPLWVLDGYTGVGKTRVLQSIQEIHPGRVLDLEKYAEHRSSILGDVGKTPSTQKTFESRLATALGALETDAPWVLIEGESRKVGDRQIPTRLWNAMQEAPRIEMVATIDRRASLLVDEYATNDGWEPVLERLEVLRGYDRIGSEGVDHVQKLIRSGDPHLAAIYLLEHHYDPRYQHGGEHKEFRFKVENLRTAQVSRELVDRLGSVTC